MVALNSLARKLQRREDLHCQRNEWRLRRELLRSLEAERAKDKLAIASDIQDRDLIDRLHHAGFRATDIAAISLAPIALVAWGSGFVTEEERDAATKALDESDLAGNRAAIEKFESWLDQRPSIELLQLWADYTRAKEDTNQWSVPETHASRLLRLAHSVAVASGGFFQLWAISPGERLVLEHIREVYSDSSR